MLIIEGADQLGKTTLCNKLIVELHKKDLPYVYRHFTRLPDCWKYPASYAGHVTQRVVQDRFHMSEIVYTAMRSEHQNLLPEGYQDIDKWIKSVSGFTVILTATGEFLRQQWAKIGREEMYSFEQNVTANNIFKRIADKKMKGYNPDFDMSIELDDFVDSSIMEAIINGYTKKLRKIEEIRGVC